MTERNDQDLWRRFADLRDRDHVNAPSFERAMNSRRAHGAKRAYNRRNIALLAGGAAVVIAAVMVARGNRPLVPIEEVSQWRPSSDVLLTMGTSSLLTSMPLLNTSVLDTIIR
jgi:hypothetical protein